MVDYEISIVLNEEYDIAVSKTVNALKEEGFGVLTEIDVKKTLKTKLNVDFERYVILGACNPPFAKRALDIEREIGLLLPCNIVVQELEERKTKVAAIDPEKMFMIIGNPELELVAKEVSTKLQRVINSLTGLDI
ncbi:MAG: DUF302 domain-containing protein [Candidatus Heimdallarchaeota archaeon]|nr:MAG: DUF302 domain-containing protein [Candidatus Heimdallarchaeota archaeon]